MDWRIPNFASDAGLIADYENAVTQQQQTEIAEAEQAIRTTYVQKRDGISTEIEATHNALEAARVRAKQTVTAYAARCPRRVSRARIVAPSFWEVLFSLGYAYRLYKDADAAFNAMMDAESAYRRSKHREEELETWLKRSLYHASLDARKRTETPEWQDEFNARPEVAPLYAKVTGVREERAAYEARLTEGTVTPQEMRDRALAERGIAPLRPPFEGVLVTEIARFGELAYLVFTDFHNNLYRLPYDRRVEPLFDLVIDTYRLADTFEAKVHRFDNGAKFTPVDHYAKRAEDRSEANAEARKRTETLKIEIADTTPVEDPEDEKVLEMLAALARSAGAQTS